MCPSLVLCSVHPSGSTYCWGAGRGEEEEEEGGERVAEVDMWGSSPFCTGCMCTFEFERGGRGRGRVEAGRGMGEEDGGRDRKVYSN